jgi:SAM-dependent methyltransferase
MAGLFAKLRSGATAFQLDRMIPTGVEARTCGFCGSANIQRGEKQWLELPYEIPKSASHLRDQMHRRDNGRCLDCGLEQSFYHFSEAGRKVFYDLGLDVLGTSPEFAVYPPSDEWRKKVFETFNYPRRLAKWEGWLQAHNITQLRRVLHLRCQYGKVLRRFHNQYGAEAWGAEVVHTCERHVREKMPFIHVPEGSLAAQIDLKFPPGAQFHFIICFHTLTHSQAIGRDLSFLHSLLAPGGVVVFCDEISKKPHNPFHMIHVDETMFTTMLKKFFPFVERIDECGNPEPSIAPYTLKHDNPDIIGRKEAA